MTLRQTLTGLLAISCLAAPAIWPAGASAAVRTCTYRNLDRGPVPHVEQVRTNLTSSAIGGGSVCEFVSQLVREVQLRGYDPGSRRPLLDGGRSWSLIHHLVYPPGWPQPTGPVADPHMHVKLRMLEQGQAQKSPLGAPTRASRFWVELNEYT